VARVEIPLDRLARLTSPPWEIQPWDTPKSFGCFVEHYLSLPSDKRTLLEAYRRYKTKIGRKSDKKVVNAPSTWRCWHDGLNGIGKAPPGSPYEFSLTWPQRALLRDIDLEKKKQAAIEQEIIEFKRREVALGKRLLERAEQMLVVPILRREVMDDGRTVIIEPTDWQEGDIARTAAAGSKLARLGYELETDKVNVTDWRQKLVAGGIDPDQFIASLFSSMAAAQQDRSGSDRK
jgi:hypothetical protein